MAKEDLEQVFPYEERFQELSKRSEEIKEILVAKEKGFTEEADIQREIRMSRIRKLLNPQGHVDYAKLPPENEARQYLIDAAKFIQKNGEDKFPSDEFILKNMLKEGMEPETCVDILEKHSPNCPTRKALIALVEKCEIREAAVACAAR